jgi:choline/glycine/proline betaine transport protein
MNTSSDLTAPSGGQSVDSPIEYHHDRVAKKGILKGMNPFVTLVAFALVVVFLGYTLSFQESAQTVIDEARSFITYYFSWYYVLIGAGFLFFNAWLALSPYGKIRLGGDAAKTEYSYFTWFAMLFAAGQGIGLIFWSIAEPMMHFQGNPFAEAGTAQAAETAMRISFFHWGLHAWAIYAVVAVCLAYAAYNRGLPLTIRSTLEPILGDRIHGYWGHAADLLAIFATLFGIATSLGLGVQQINAGLNYVFGIEISTTVQLLLIAGITAVAVCSVCSGVGRGIKIFSQLNFWLSILLMGFFLIWGPSRYLIMLFVESTGDYLANFIPLSFWTDASSQDPSAWSGWKSTWQGWWTVFYWGWWVSWAPFVGVFIARISKGRTLREFMSGVILVPTIFTFIWLALFGGTALSIDLFGAGGVGTAVSENLTTALYVTFDLMNVGDLAMVIGAMGTLLVATYFITSSDSGTLVLTMIMSNGNPHPLIRHRVTWGVLEGLVAAILLVAGGAAALSLLQTASIVAALPFSFIMVLMCYCLVKALKKDQISA